MSGRVVEQGPRDPAFGTAPERAGASAALVAIVVGTLLRLASFPFAEDLWADAPVRGDLAAAWAQRPGLWWTFERACQFGPLPLHLEGLLIRGGLPSSSGARLLPLLCGVAGLWLAARLGARLASDTRGGADGAKLAAWALALSPLHIQASTTCASEAVYVAFLLGLALSALEGRTGWLLLCAFCASTTRFDLWLALPALSLWLLWRARAARGRISLCDALSSLGLWLGPASILLANGLATGRPWAPLSHISRDHAALAAPFLAWAGPLGWRLGSALFWLAAPLVVLTPGFGLCALRSAWDGLRRLGAVARDAGAALLPALLPPLVYAGRALILGDFLPMLRLALPPSVLLCAAAPRRPNRPLATSIAVALAFDAALLLVALAPGPPQELAQRVSPLSRLPDDLRAGAAWLRAAPTSSALDRSPRWEDIVMAHAAGLDRFALYEPGRPPAQVVAIEGGALDRSLREEGSALGVHCRRQEARGRVSRWRCGQ
jgi:hypothetical protein